MDPIYHFAPNPFPAQLREELPYPSAPWLVSRELFKRLAAAPEVNSAYKKIELHPDDPEAMFVQKYYEHNPPPGKGIRRIYVIQSGNQTEGFEAELRKCELEAPKFQPNWSRESEAEHRDEVYAEWQGIADQFIPLEIATSRRIYRIIHARVLPLWHGTSQQIADSICESGFTFFGKHHLFDPNAKEGKFASTDAGFFGSGIYFTDSPSYAAKYSKENILMLAFIAMRTPFPIVGDVPHPSQCSDMRRFMGKELYQEYNAHFIPVAPIAPGSMQYYPCHFEQPECNEYVIKMPSQTLARYQVEIGDGFPLFQAIITQGKNNLPLPKRRGGNEITSEVLVEKLRAHYTAICTDLPLPMSEATFPLKELFTQLIILENRIVEKKEQEEKEKPEVAFRDPSLPERDSLAEAMAHLQETTKPIAMEEFFAKEESFKEPKKVLLIGRAGIGKTTLIDRITLGWTEGEMFPQFQAVFRLVLRELNDFQEPSQNLQWLAAAISHAIYKDRDRFHDVLAYIQEHESRILILLDGLDEASEELIQKIDPLLQIPELHILISSRPGVPVAIKNRTDRQIENTGFSRTQMEQYATKFFTRVSKDANQTTPFLNAIRGNHNLFNLAHNPLQLQMLCTLWETGAKDKGFGNSLTVLYTEMLMQLYLWHVRKQNPYADMSGITIDEKLIEGLGKVAMAGLEARQLMLSEATLRQALHGTSVSIAQLRATGLLKKSGRDYTFFHLTFQEYLIAYYVSFLPSKEQWDFIRTNRYKPHYRLVMSFLAGHIYRSDQTKDKARTKHFFETLFSAGADLAGYVQLELTLRSAAECPSLYEWVNVTFGVEEALRKSLASYFDAKNDVYQTKMLKNLLQLCLFRRIDVNNDWLTNDLNKMLDRKQGDERYKVLRVIPALAPTLNKDNEILTNIIESLATVDDLSETAAAFEAVIQMIRNIEAKEKLNHTIISKIVDLLDHHFFPSQALEALSEIIAKQELDKTIIFKIAEFLTDSKSNVQTTAVLIAVRALGEIGEKQKLDETIISKITELLADNDDSKRYEAIQALERIEAKHELGETIISQIFTLLDDSYKNVRLAAAYAFGKIGTKQKLDEAIIFKIITLLDDSDKYVRLAAADVIGEIGAKQELDETTISKIVELLTDSDSEMRPKAVEALGKIGAKQKLDETIIFKIVDLFTDSIDYVRSAAVQALRCVGTKQKLDETIISEITDFLVYNASHVRYAAIQALVEIGANEKLDQINISKIAELLAHRTKDVRRQALEALAKIGAQKEFDETIISKIAEFLAYSERHVRYATVQALGEIEANEKLDETIVSKIVELLTHRAKDMRRQALEALGKIGAKKQFDETILYKIGELLAISEWHKRSEAVEVLERIGAKKQFDETILSKIAGLLAHKDGDVRSAAKEALIMIGANQKLDKTIISKIAALLAHSKWYVGDAAVQVLGKIGAKQEFDKTINSKIVRLLAHRKWHVRDAAVQVIEKIGAKQEFDETIISKLAELLANSNKGVRFATAQAIGKISLQSLIKFSLVNARPLLEQAFLRQALVCIEHINKKDYLVIWEKGEEIRISLPKSKIIIDSATQNGFLGSFVKRNSNNKHLAQLTFFKEEEQKKDNCIMQ